MLAHAGTLKKTKQLQLQQVDKILCPEYIYIWMEKLFPNISVSKGQSAATERAKKNSGTHIALRKWSYHKLLI
jgi:hypothetical protein